MKCLVCKNGDTELGVATVTLERDNTTVVFKSVPAQVCQNCGEAYFDDDIVGRLSTIVDTAARTGVRVDVRDYVAA
jgi:YgiT-type zinc finger domain-containing protein